MSGEIEFRGIRGMNRAFAKSWMLMPVFAALAGCVSLAEDPPKQLIALSSEQRAPAGDIASGEIGDAIVILDPDSDRRIDVARVAVQVSDSAVAYLKDAAWVEKPARQFRRVLAETVRARTSRVVVEGSDFEVSGKTTVSGRLTAMGYDAPSRSVVVRFDAVVAQEGGKVSSRRFESIIPDVRPKAKYVGPALNTAANDVAVQVADWLGPTGIPTT